MNRTVITIAAAGVALMCGCRSTCSRKACCNTCAPPPVQLVAPNTSNAAPEVWLPAAPVPQTQVPPPASFPVEPRAANFGTANPSRIANAPQEIILEKPEYTETNRREVTSLKTVSGSTGNKPIAFLEIAPGRLATGPRPTLDELDRLQRAGYRRVYVVGPNNNLNDSDKRVFASRGLTIEAATAKITTTEPTYVFADDTKQLRDWWVRHIKESEFVSDEAARIRADRLFQ